MDIEVKICINQYIKILDNLLNNSEKLVKIEYKEWIPNCIKCLQFALENEQLLIDKPSLYSDTQSTISLIYSWLVEEKSWAYVELYQKFKIIYNPKEINEAFEKIVTILNENKNKEGGSLNETIDCLNNVGISCLDNNGNFKPINEVLRELNEKFKHNV